jgi:hypothetical protein
VTLLAAQQLRTSNFAKHLFLGRAAAMIIRDRLPRLPTNEGWMS